jgi:uncharacterized membrane protein (UPF0127 family)
VDRETVAVAQDSTGDTAPPSIVHETVGVQPEGFTTATVEIIKADGTICEVCMWLADTAEERSRGLMGVTDLGTAAGMAFVFEQPTSGSFYMFQTVTPLSIGWFAPGGALVSMADMAPCESNDSSQRPFPGWRRVRPCHRSLSRRPGGGRCRAWIERQSDQSNRSRGVPGRLHLVTARLYG